MRAEHYLVAAWGGVWVPLLDETASLEASLSGGDAGYPLEGGERFVDLTTLWDPGDVRAEELVVRWRRSNLPAIAFFGIRRLDEEGPERSARPCTYAKREAAGPAGPSVAHHLTMELDDT